jgi:hypothetical protein
MSLSLETVIKVLLALGVMMALYYVFFKQNKETFYDYRLNPNENQAYNTDFEDEGEYVIEDDEDEDIEEVYDEGDDEPVDEEDDYEYAEDDQLFDDEDDNIVVDEEDEDVVVDESDDVVIDDSEDEEYNIEKLYSTLDSEDENFTLYENTVGIDTSYT